MNNTAHQNNTGRFCGWISVRMLCVPTETRPTYGLTASETAEQIIIDTEDCEGITVYDQSEPHAFTALGRLDYYTELLIEADTLEAALEALDQAAVFVPGYDLDTFTATLAPCEV